MYRYFLAGRCRFKYSVQHNSMINGLTPFIWVFEWNFFVHTILPQFPQNTEIINTPILHNGLFHRAFHCKSIFLKDFFGCIVWIIYQPGDPQNIKLIKSNLTYLPDCLCHNFVRPLPSPLRRRFQFPDLFLMLFIFPPYKRILPVLILPPAREISRLHLDRLPIQNQNMIDAGIHSGDIVIVDKSNRNPGPHEIAMCELNGEYTLKHFILEEGQGWLVPANPEYPKIRITPDDDFSVWGTVTYIIHKARD